jgi:MerR family mercuric resistance operon transcriptional regulator
MDRVNRPTHLVLQRLHMDIRRRRRLGVSHHALDIRYYERIGILQTPECTAAKYGVYTPEHMKRLRFIRRCRDLGFSGESDSGPSSSVFGNAPTCAEVCHITDQEVHEIEAKIRHVQRPLAELQRVRSSCTGNRPMADCRIIETLSAY